MSFDPFTAVRAGTCQLCGQPTNPGDLIASLRMLAYGGGRYAHAACVPESIRELGDWRCQGTIKPGPRGGSARRCQRGTGYGQTYCPTHSRDAA